MLSKNYLPFSSENPRKSYFADLHWKSDDELRKNVTKISRFGPFFAHRRRHNFWKIWQPCL